MINIISENSILSWEYFLYRSNALECLMYGIMLLWISLKGFAEINRKSSP